MKSRVNDPYDRAFIESVLNIRLNATDHTLAAATDDGAAYVVLAFQHYTGNDMELTIASNGQRWCQRVFLKTAFSYVFEACTARRCTVRVREDNMESRRLVQRLGFKREGCLRQGAENGMDLIIYGMLRNECRWIDGQQQQQERREHPGRGPQGADDAISRIEPDGHPKPVGVVAMGTRA